MKRTTKIAVSLIALGLIALILLPRWAPVNAVSWAPPFNPGLTGAFAPNQALSAIIEIPVGTAPEHVACDASGALYTSLDDGGTYHWVGVCLSPSLLRQFKRTAHESLILSL